MLEPYHSCYGWKWLFLAKSHHINFAHGPWGPLFAQFGPKNGNFQRFLQTFFRTTWFWSKFLILIEFPNIFHWKPATKLRLGVVLGQNLGQIRSNVVKKVKKQALPWFFHFTWAIPFKAKSSSCKTTWVKFSGNCS